MVRLVLQVVNLGRFISVLKFRPLQWQNTHPYILADRMEDITEPHAKETDFTADRRICVFGYVRGTNFKPGMRFHIPGCGDVSLDDVRLMNDPCPPPDIAKDTKRHRLNDKERVIYAPMSDVGASTFSSALFKDYCIIICLIYEKAVCYSLTFPSWSISCLQVGGILYDQDATLMDVGERRSNADGHLGSRAALLDEIKSSKMDSERTPAAFSLFTGSTPLDADAGEKLVARDLELASKGQINGNEIEKKTRVRRAAGPHGIPIDSSGIEGIGDQDDDLQVCCS